MTLYYPTLTPAEKLSYHTTLGLRLLTHRYRYYVLDEPELADWEYDELEKWYEKVSLDVGQESVVRDMVGWNGDTLLAKEAEGQVLSMTDDYATWMRDMREVWERLGPPRYERNKNVDPL